MLLVLQLMNVERKLNEMKTNSNITVSPCRILLFFSIIDLSAHKMLRQVNYFKSIG